MNDASRGYFEERARQEGNSPLGQQIRAWLANPNDGAAADAIEANPLEVGLTRTRCVATMLKGGHADNALPQSAQATVNCRIMPGVAAEGRAGRAPAARRRQGRGHARSRIISACRRRRRRCGPTCSKAVTKAIAALPRAGDARLPLMSTGASDGSFFRAQGIPVYDVDGSWGISPDDERAHGLDERIPVRAMYDDVLHWEMIFKALAG